MKRSVLDYLENTAKRCPERLAWDASAPFTFGQWWDAAQRIASSLSSRCARNTPVAVLMNPRSAECVKVFFGVWAAGCFYAPLDPMLPPERLKLIMQNLQPTAIVYDEESRAKAEAVCPDGCECVLWSDAAQSPVDADKLAQIRQTVTPDHLAAILYTSGSTGITKGVAHTQGSLMAYTEETIERYQFTENTVFGNQSPFYFDTSCKDLYQTLKLGATCVILEKKFFALPLFLLQALDRNGVTAVNWATSAFHLAASSGALEKCVPHALRKIVVGGEALQARYVNMWKRAIPEAELYNMYGPTETTVDCAALHLTRTYRDDEPIPIGRACRNMQLLLLKDDLTEAAPGETGELCVRGSGLAAGYFADAEKTNSAFIQNPLCPDYRDILYRTGDMAVQREDGNFYFLARRDGQIKHMGYRIELGEIETALYSVKGLREAVCFYDAMRDKIVCVYAGDLDTNTLAKALRTALPKYMLPNVYEKLDALPHNANGKLDRAALKERFLHAQS